MKLLNKTMLTTALLSIFMLSQPVMAGRAEQNDTASNMSISHDIHHVNKDAIFGDDANHQNYSAGHSVGDISHGDSNVKFTSVLHQTVKQSILGDDVNR